jgi:EmrB/QacA subfamily drug resistance transporter
VKKDRRWFVLATLSLVQLAIVTDTTIVNVALPDIGRDLHMGEVSLAWVVNAYLVAAGGLLLLGGRIADLLGRRRMFLAGAAIFALASAACALAPSPGVLVGARALQGVGEALASPSALSIIAVAFPASKDRAKALGLWGGLAGLGATLGVTLSGVLVTIAGWPAIFWVNVPIVAVAVLVLPRLLPSDHPPTVTPRARVDVTGAALLTMGVLAVIQGLVLAADHGIVSVLTLGPVVIGAGLLAAFVAVEARHPHPLVPLSFFGNRPRLIANLASMFVVGSMSSMFIVLTLLQQNTLGRTALETGLSYVPFCIVFVVGIFVSVVLIGRVGETWTAVLAFGVAAAGMGLLAGRLAADGSYVAETLPAMLVLAVGFGLAMPPLQNAAMSALSDAEAGLGAGVQTTVQSFGNAVGVAMAVVVSLFFAGHSGAVDPVVAAVDGARAAFVAAMLALLAGLAVTACFLRMPSTPPEPADLEAQGPVEYGSKAR